jgi:AhpD family alkylhydroperoxidase
MIAVGVALTTQCLYCIDIHAESARKAGAAETEIAEAARVAIAPRAGAAVTHTTHVLADCALVSECCLRGKGAVGTSADHGHRRYAKTARCWVRTSDFSRVKRALYH